MRLRTLGSSDLSVSELALGSWLTYGVGVDADTTQRCVSAAFDVGIHFFDTANSYGQGAAEKALGAALAEHPRDSYVLATRLFFPMSEQYSGLSAAQVRQQRVVARPAGAGLDAASVRRGGGNHRCEST